MEERHFDPAYRDLIQANRQTKESAYTDQQQYEVKMRSEALNRIVESVDGFLFFQWFCEYLGFKGSVLAAVNGKLDTDSMVFNEARRLVWKDLRVLLTVPNRNKIEEDI